MATALGDERFLLVTTFKRSGEPVATPVWIAPLPDGRIGFTTSQGTWKVKRLRRNPAVRLQPCSRRGDPRPGSQVSDGTGEVFTDGPRMAEVESAIRAKYGVQFALLHGLGALLARVRRRRDVTFAHNAVVVLTVSD